MNAMQRIYRLSSISRLPHPECGQRVLAKLWRNSHAVNVEWWSANTDPRLLVGCLVLVKGAMLRVNEDRQLIFGSLQCVDSPNSELNLFQTIPEDWHVNPSSCAAASKLWESLPASHRQLFNQLFWDVGRFKRYLTAIRDTSTRVPVLHFDWVIEATKNSLVGSEDDSPQGCADLILTGLLLDAGSLERRPPNSYISLLEWLLLAVRQNGLLDGSLMERLSWRIVQVHALLDREPPPAKTLGETRKSLYSAE